MIPSSSLKFIVLYITPSLLIHPLSTNEAKWRNWPPVKREKGWYTLSLSSQLLLSCVSVHIISSGNLGSQLVEYKEEMYITADCGKTWRQVRIKDSLQQWLLSLQKRFIVAFSVTLRHTQCLLSIHFTSVKILLFFNSVSLSFVF